MATPLKPNPPLVQHAQARIRNLISDRLEELRLHALTNDPEEVWRKVCMDILTAQEVELRELVFALNSNALRETMREIAFEIMEQHAIEQRANRAVIAACMELGEELEENMRKFNEAIKTGTPVELAFPVRDRINKEAAKAAMSG